MYGYMLHQYLYLYEYKYKYKYKYKYEYKYEYECNECTHKHTRRNTIGAEREQSVCEEPMLPSGSCL